MKVLFHINESERWEMVLTNVKNMLDYFQSADMEIIIEIVANGFAVLELKEQDLDSNMLYKAMLELSEKKIELVACRNALKSLNINEHELYPFIKTVPAGVVELAIKQCEGYSYIKP